MSWLTQELDRNSNEGIITQIDIILTIETIVDKIQTPKDKILGIAPKYLPNVSVLLNLDFGHSYLVLLAHVWVLWHVGNNTDRYNSTGEIAKTCNGKIFKRPQ